MQNTFNTKLANGVFGPGPGVRSKLYNINQTPIIKDINNFQVANHLQHSRILCMVTPGPELVGVSNIVSRQIFCIFLSLEDAHFQLL